MNNYDAMALYNIVSGNMTYSCNWWMNCKSYERIGELKNYVPRFFRLLDLI